MMILSWWNASPYTNDRWKIVGEVKILLDSWLEELGDDLQVKQTILGYRVRFPRAFEEIFPATIALSIYADVARHKAKSKAWNTSRGRGVSLDDLIAIFQEF
ncbi:hypothetical protein BC829DRAFT_119383 [Chytridium lagenaria]|nr:hypothetical protein BC829DRAFT_119383 [Chytridium lagenaria]